MIQIMINREELAWAAGFFDGEGCATFHRQKRRSGKLGRGVRLTVTQMHEAPLVRFQEAVGGLGTVRGYTNSLDKIAYRWVISSFWGVQAVSAMMWPFLCQVKRTQITNSLNNYHNHGSVGKDANE